MTRPALSAVVAVVLVAAAAAGSDAQVFLRGQKEPLDGTVEAVSLDGVAVKESAAGPRRVVGWDLVRRVHGPHGAQAEAFLSVADGVWRARARIERSDLIEAEPVLEELFVTFRATGGPTAAVVHEGLLRCRLARGGGDAAVWPWLAWTARLNEVGLPRSRQWLGGTINRPPIRDEATGLVGPLPPIFAGDRGALALAGSAEWEQFAAADRVTLELAQLYRASATFETGRAGSLATFPLAGKGQPDHPGVRLVNEIVVSRIGEKEQRRTARALLEQRIRGTLAAQAAAELSGAPADPVWLEAWCRAAVGRSLLREDEVKDRRRGVTELLHVPARFADSLPTLAALSLAEAAIAMRELGDPGSSAILVGELRAGYPGHPIQEWDRLRDLMNPTPSGGRPAEPAIPKAPPTDGRHAATR